jgi:glycosyltransferase involved in cell wall biosynthesis
MKMFFNFSKKTKIHLYTICWNEEYMLKYFFKYYDGLVDRYVFFDDGSTDQTLSILRKHPKVEIRSFPRPDVDSYVLAAQNVHNSCWKESRGSADWVIITAVDEFLYAVPNLKTYLAECAKKGITAIPALGVQMISNSLPSSNQNLPDLVKRGCPWKMMNKLSIFNPNKITETNQSLGRHAAKPSGEIKYPEKDRLLLLHYKYLSFEATFKRHAELQEKLGTVDKENGWGIQYSWERERFKNEWDYCEQNSLENILSRDYDPHLEHFPLEKRWWRNQTAAN